MSYLFHELIIDGQLFALLLIFAIHKLQLLLDMRQYLHGIVNFLLQLHELLISLLDLLVVRLILDLQLLKVNHVQAFAKFLFRLQLVLLLFELILELDVLNAHADYFALFLSLSVQVEFDFFQSKGATRLGHYRAETRVFFHFDKEHALLINVTLAFLTLELEFVELSFGIELFVLQLFAQTLDGRLQVRILM